MKRISEPEVMDGVEQAAAYTAADFSDANRLFVNLFRKFFPDMQSGRFVDLGCGPADIPVRLCRELSGIFVTALDASGPMIDLAKKAVAASRQQAHIDLVCASVSDFVNCCAPFDAVLSNSLLHHIPDPLGLWRDVVRLAAPKAVMLVMDLRRPGSKDEARAIVKAVSQNDPPILKKDFYHSLLAAYTPDEVRDQLDAVGLERMTVDVVSDRHLAVWGRFPDN